MAKRSRDADPVERTNELLRKLTIVQLGLAGVGQAQIREIVGGAMIDVAATVQLLNSGRRGKDRK